MRMTSLMLLTSFLHDTKMSKPLRLVIDFNQADFSCLSILHPCSAGIIPVSHASLGTVFHHVLSLFSFRFPFLTPSTPLSATSDMQLSSFHFWPNLFSSCNFFFTLLRNLSWTEKMIQELPFKHEWTGINHCGVQSREVNWFGEIKYWYCALRASTKLGNFANFAWPYESWCEKILKYK